MNRKWNLAYAAFVALIALALAGCGTQAQRVDCDWRLKPINPPVKTAAPASSKARADKP